MTSRETSEYFMPSVPIEMPSEMVMVLKITPLPPAASTPFGSMASCRCACCRGDHAPGGGDADEGLGEILFLEADGVEHGAAGRAVGAELWMGNGFFASGPGNSPLNHSELADPAKRCESGLMKVTLEKTRNHRVP
jgi:hypothetical protein